MKHLRKRSKLNQEFVASHIEVALRTYQAYEAGDSIPRFDAACKLCKLFHVSFKDLAMGLGLDVDGVPDKTPF